MVLYLSKEYLCESDRNERDMNLNPVILISPPVPLIITPPAHPRNLYLCTCVSSYFICCMRIILI